MHETLRNLALDVITSDERLLIKGRKLCLVKGCTSDQMARHCKIFFDTYTEKRDESYGYRTDSDSGKDSNFFASQLDKEYGEARAFNELERLHGN